MTKSNIGKSIKKASAILLAEGVVAIPTETVYGLAGNIFSEKAIAKIYQIKKRPRSNPLIVHVQSVAMAKELVKDFPPVAELLAKKFWPGPLTLVLAKNNKVGKWLTAGQNTVAIRMPQHPMALALLKETGLPLAAPSANPFMYISPVTAQQVHTMLGSKIDYILNGGRCKQGIESTIVYVKGSTIKILRAGSITEKAIEKALQKTVIKKTSKQVAHAGQHKKHYSPHTPLLLSEDVKATAHQYAGKKVAVLSFQKRYKLPAGTKQLQLTTTGNLQEAASNLYNMLHKLDNGAYDIIIAEKLPDTGLGIAINEKLTKAAYK